MENSEDTKISNKINFIALPQSPIDASKIEKAIGVVPSERILISLNLAWEKSRGYQITEELFLRNLSSFVSTICNSLKEGINHDINFWSELFYCFSKLITWNPPNKKNYSKFGRKLTGLIRQLSDLKIKHSQKLLAFEDDSCYSPILAWEKEGVASYIGGITYVDECEKYLRRVYANSSRALKTYQGGANEKVFELIYLHKLKVLFEYHLEIGKVSINDLAGNRFEKPSDENRVTITNLITNGCYIFQINMTEKAIRGQLGKLKKSSQVKFIKEYELGHMDSLKIPIQIIKSGESIKKV